MVQDVADRLTAQRAQSSSDFINPVDQLLRPSPNSSLEQYYSNSNSNSKPSPTNSAQQKKIVNADKMSWMSNALAQAAQIKPQLNALDNWVEWNQNLNGTLAITNLWKVLTGDKVPSSDADDETYAIGKTIKRASMMFYF